ncbi:hypothetical protein [Geomicrobium sp. JCM 19039]|uniref:hypothetical protein n=1 Tax=Geomicrobium sp. JCM 19039 TaxID=1460636 RepID=UPI00045F3878|nr:hypothetical protein [Geomicrobium sp. JCM 19039]GAK14225.1 hypothetical protein JCM19039_4127 [Geomicrobium sp. JCM 19039]
MDAHILTLSGNTKFTITLDPTVWIFDNRKVDLDTYFHEESISEENNEPEFGPRRWQTNQIRTKKEASIEGSYGMKLSPFIDNAEPSAGATTITAVTKDGEEHQSSLDVGKDWIACFSEDGKAIKETGPLHIYFGDGSNQHAPITHVTALRID